MTSRKRYPSIEREIERVRESFSGDGRIPETFRACIEDTLDKTIRVQPDGSVFVITGDIPAMWLRDSACQLHLFTRFAKEEPEIRDIIIGLVRRQVDCILIDSYANAFNEDGDGRCFEHDHTEMKKEIWERKYEIDSLCYPVQLSWNFWKETGETAHFTPDWKKAALRIIETLRTEQDHENCSPYRFQRDNCVFTDTLSRDGRGALVKSRIGLVFSGFRPSDDACVYGYNIPENMFASVALSYIAEIAEKVYRDETLAQEAADFSHEIREAIDRYGFLPNLDRKVYAYEVDGFGQYLLMDDANVPSLLAMPYLGYCSREDEAYQNTRKVILSEANPYYYQGRCLRGIGSPHTPTGYVWDISLAVQGLTSDSIEEKKMLLEMMVRNDAGTHQMHESIDADNSAHYTRPWFSWANSMFCELVLDVMDNA